LHKHQKVFAKKASFFQFFKTWLKEMISLRQRKAQSRRKFRWEVAKQHSTEETRLAITHELKAVLKTKTTRPIGKLQ